MRTSELLGHLRGLGVKVWSENGELRCSAPKGALTAELRGALQERKQEILSVLAAAGAERGRAAGDPIPSLAGRPAVERPLSFTQQRLWFLQRLDPRLAAYNIPMSWTLRGPLDAEALERALREVLQRHEVLRTFFPTEHGRPYPGLGSPEDVVLERVARPASSEAVAWRTEVRARLEARAAEPFDLARFPLIRPALFELGDDEHVLFCLVHHAVFDGWSLSRFLDELCALYAAFSAGRPSPLAELPLQYADYAAWQREVLSGANWQRELDHWRGALSGELPVLGLPLDRPRPPVQTFVGAKAGRPLPAELVRSAAAFASGEGGSLFMAALAGYAALLHRYTGSEDLVVATPIAGRERPELSELIGFFANTLVLRTSAAGRPSFRELFARVRATCLAAFEHQAMPFERLVDELAPERNLAYTPLFQTLFLIEDGVGEGVAMGPLEVTPFELETRVARADLMLYLYREREAGSKPEGGVSGRWSAWAEYNTDLFDASTMEALLEHYERLLAAALAAPDVALAELDYLAPEERSRLVVEWNSTAAPIPELAVHRQFEAQVAQRPEATAVLVPSLDSRGSGDERVSYAELDARANRLAHHLRARGAGAGQLIGLCLERSSEMLVAQLAILKAGAAYVPLDPAFPPERLAYMVADARLELVVTDAELAGSVLPSGPVTLLVDAEASEIAAQPSTSPQVEVGPRERMYVIYTSGSTGRPKGVELEHRSVSNFLASMAREPGFAPGESILAVTTLSFDIAVLELFLPLATGGTTIVAPRAATASGAELARLVERLRPSALQATPSTWRMLLAAGWEGDPELRAFCGGEALPRELAGELSGACRELWNLYGPTETTVWSAVARVSPGAKGPVPIGRPIANTAVYVLDRERRPVPAGVVGELWIGGQGLARGYLGRPELTAERFVPDPFAPRPDGGADAPRMYRTGDLARWLRDGTLECLGRQDGQVKLRGHRIELGEIEALLEAEPGVGACAAVVREDVPGDQRLVAYHSPQSPGDEPARTELLRARARGFLPGYMVPQRFVALEALPLTPNGKVDRRALLALAPPEVEPAAPADPAVDGAPRSELERGIADVWRTALRLERVPIDASFFDLGGHSLLLAEVQVRLQEELETDVSIVELFQYPTVAGLAAHLERGRSAGSEVDADRRERRSRNLASGRRTLRQRRGIRE